MLGFKEERRFPWAYKGPPLYFRAIIEAICYSGWWVMEAQDYWVLGRRDGHLECR